MFFDKKLLLFHTSQLRESISILWATVFSGFRLMWWKNICRNSGVVGFGLINVCGSLSYDFFFNILFLSLLELALFWVEGWVICLNKYGTFAFEINEPWCFWIYRIRPCHIYICSKITVQNQAWRFFPHFCLKLNRKKYI